MRIIYKGEKRTRRSERGRGMLEDIYIYIYHRSGDVNIAATAAGSVDYRGLLVSLGSTSPIPVYR
jgi:hypothetical protein